MYLRRLTMVAAAAFVLGFSPIEATVSNGSVTPSSVTFTSSNPSGSVAGTPSTTTVSFKTTANPSAFTVHVKAVGSAFTGCNTPPATAVTVACSSGSGVTCAASAALINSGNGTTVATGSGNHNPASFVLTYTFTDSWKYLQGASCSLSTQVIYTEP
ncbi:MAG TPA: hypothetical protein VKV15_05975 [Bryobacteraceae bacterium]|nr:hypothetical protein [Bryobacteraceae bacterium]